jgi:nitrite reductase/ring-hydroxylating ferredoxin subunit
MDAVRNRGLLLVLGGALVAALIVFLAQRSPIYQYSPPYIVARAAEVSGTPEPIQVVLQRGADRTLQRYRTDWRCPPVPGQMGCPASIEVRSITVFLVRDEGGALHAFIGEDPRNGCALEWLTSPAVFHDVCHGSIYDRRGQRVGGPSPWNLNQLATEIRDGDVYIDPGRIVVGDCPGCPVPNSSLRTVNRGRQQSIRDGGLDLLRPAA